MDSADKTFAVYTLLLDGSALFGRVVASLYYFQLFNKVGKLALMLKSKNKETNDMIYKLNLLLLDFSFSSTVSGRQPTALYSVQIFRPFSNTQIKGTKSSYLKSVLNQVKAQFIKILVKMVLVQIL